MSGNGNCFVEWKEQFVCQERGNRVVHYFLKDSAGESVLAVVGTERSVRHMFYVVAEEFLQVHGKESNIHAGFKWRSRREVVDWLTSMLSKQHLHGDQSESPTRDRSQASGLPEMIRVTGTRKQGPDYTGHLAKNFKGHNSDIVWSGIAWMCGKQLKHYPAFCRNGITIAIQSFVFVMAKGENRYLAYLEDMYEDKRGQKKVRVRWFHHNQEVKGVIPLRNPHPKEVFITPYAQVISAECVDGPATILTEEHYEKCLTVFPHALLAKVHLCHRQFRSNRVKPFDLSKLRGYFDQPILSCLDPAFLQKPEFISNSLIEAEGDELSPNENVKLGAKRTRSGTEQSRLRSCTGGRQMMTYGPYQNLNCDFSGGRLFSLKHVGQPWFTPPFKANEKIELLCQDSGIRGCWFRCTVLQASRKQIKVQYDDVQDEDGSGNLEEWIPAFKLAMPDKLGIRRSGRPTVRPAPDKGQTDLALEVGAVVDAWWSDGWWEGVVTGVEDCGDDVQVFIPGESLRLNINKRDLRISREWLGDQWFNIEAKPDVISAITATSISGTNPCLSSSIGKDVKSDALASSSIEAPASTNCDIAEEENLNGTASASSDGLSKSMDWVNGDNSPSLKESGHDDDFVDTNDSCDNIDNMQGNDGDDKDDNDHDEGRVGMEMLETSGQSCKAVEVMEVTV
ncbi:uncharacterized protein LOC107434541 isoform X2 [Ziziphus jujuba]|uniref:Uncharacterized protein LOC107434541 isoform X2 n=1 Tax=Ziziphus jujuba TaxID=326968 RepID=A0A6P4AS01_ZIZJJ|nr:uncharacterized protein LOC107434541 isoform X2 [Ziziphus jujuba]